MLNEPIQLTTAVIDLITSLLGFIFSFLLTKVNGDKKLKNKWIHFFISMSVGNFCGFLFHFFNWNQTVLKFLWIGLFLVMYDIAIMFLLIMVYDLKQDACPTKKQRIILIIITSLFYIASNIYTFIKEVDMRIFVIYAAIVVVAGIIIAIYLFVKEKRQSMAILSIVLIPQLFGGYFQITKSGYFKLIFEFNEDGIYHLCLLLTVVIIYFGARKDILIGVNKKQA